MVESYIEADPEYTPQVPDAVSNGDSSNADSSNAAVDTNEYLNPRVFARLDFNDEKETIEPGDVIRYTILIRNRSLYSVYNLKFGVCTGNASSLSGDRIWEEEFPHGYWCRPYGAGIIVTEQDVLRGCIEGSIVIEYIDRFNAKRIITLDSTVMIHGGRYGKTAAPTIGEYTEPDDLTYNYANRDIAMCLKLKEEEALTHSDGYEDSCSIPVHSVILPEEIIRFESSTSLGSSNGISFGSTEAGTYSFEIDKRVSYKVTSALNEYNRVAVYAFVGIKSKSATDYVWTPFGAFLVDSCDVPEQSLTVTVRGSDYLNHYAMDSLLYNDASTTKNGITYAQYLNNLMKSIFGSFPKWDGVLFTNHEVHGVRSPNYGTQAPTVRTLLSWFSEMCGAYVCIDRVGRICIRSFGRTSKEYHITTDTYTKITKAPSQFMLNGIWTVEDDLGRSRSILAGDDTVDRWGSYEVLRNRVFVDVDNPLSYHRDAYKHCMKQVYDAILNGVWHYGGKKYLNSGSIDWIGDPLVKLGDVITVTDTSGEEFRLMVQSSKYTFDAGGLSQTISCDFGSDYDSRTKYVQHGFILRDQD